MDLQYVTDPYFIERKKDQTILLTFASTFVHSRVPDERFLRICLNGITLTCMIHRWNEENKPHRIKDDVVMYCGHVFLKLGSKVKI